LAQVKGDRPTSIANHPLRCAVTATAAHQNQIDSPHLTPVPFHGIIASILKDADQDK
jgi:hypothetical protein